jgi:hypothetical protein
VIAAVSFKQEEQVQGFEVAPGRMIFLAVCEIVELSRNVGEREMGSPSPKASLKKRQSYLLQTVL